MPSDAGPYVCYPYLALGVFALLAADAGVLIHAAVPAPAFVAGWLAVALVIAWGWLVCVPLTVEVSAGLLEYEAPATSGRLPLRRVTALRPLLGTAALLGLAGRVPLVVPVRSGFALLAAQLTGHPCRPSIPAPRRPIGQQPARENVT